MPPAYMITKYPSLNGVKVLQYDVMIDKIDDCIEILLIIVQV